VGVIVFPATAQAQVGIQVSPAHGGHYYPGLMNVRDLSTPPPGYFLSVYNFVATSGEFIDRDGNPVDQLPIGTPPVDTNVSLQLYALAPLLGWAFDLGSGFRYEVGIAPSLLHANVGVSFDRGGVGRGAGDSTTGLGDLFVAPAYFSYGSEFFDVTAGYALFAPTGRYTTGATDNIGLGHFTNLFQLAGYFYLFEQATALTVALTYELPTGVYDADIRTGQRFTIEYGVSQYLLPWLELSVFGGHNWQVTEDSGSDVIYDTSVRDRKFVIGGAAAVWATEYAQVNFRATHEYGIRQGFQSTTVGLNIMFILGLTAQQEGPFPWFERVERANAAGDAEAEAVGAPAEPEPGPEPEAEEDVEAVVQAETENEVQAEPDPDPDPEAGAETEMEAVEPSISAEPPAE